MSHTSLTPELAGKASELAAAFAACQKVVAAKARIGLFYQNADATDLFRKVNEYGEKLRNKSMEGMPPSEEEISRFDSLRQAVVDNPLCKGFLDARQELDDMLAAVNQYLVLAINKGEAPSDSEVADSLEQQMSSCSCGCHGEGEGGCGECHGECNGECKGECGGHGDGCHCGQH